MVDTYNTKNASISSFMMNNRFGSYLDQQMEIKPLSQRVSWRLNNDTFA